MCCGHGQCVLQRVSLESTGKSSRLLKWMSVTRIELNLGFEKNGFPGEKNVWLQAN